MLVIKDIVDLADTSKFDHRSIGLTLLEPDEIIDAVGVHSGPSVVSKDLKSPVLDVALLKLLLLLHQGQLDLSCLLCLLQKLLLHVAPDIELDVGYTYCLGAKEVDLLLLWVVRELT